LTRTQAGDSHLAYAPKEEEDYAWTGPALVQCLLLSPGSNACSWCLAQQPGAPPPGRSVLQLVHAEGGGHRSHWRAM